MVVWGGREEMAGPAVRALHRATVPPVVQKWYCIRKRVNAAVCSTHYSTAQLLLITFKEILIKCILIGTVQK